MFLSSEKFYVMACLPFERNVLNQKEIFKLLKPGSIVFFIAGRRNMKNVSTLHFLKKFVNIKFGPCKATSKNAPLDPNVPDTTGLKTAQWDRTYFMVLEKKFITERKDLNTSERVPESTGKKSSKIENNVILTPSVSSCDVSITDNSEVEYTDIYNSNIEYTDIDSISVTSSYKDSDITTDESKSVSCEYLHLLGVTHQIVEDSVKQEQSENLSDNTFQIKLQTYLDENKNKELTSNINGPIVEHEDCFKSVHADSLREFDEKLKSNMPKENVNQYTCKNELMEVIASYSNNKDDSLNENILTYASSPKMTCKTRVEFEKSVKSGHFTINDPACEDASTDQFPSSVKYIPSHEKVLKEKSFSEQKKSVNDINCLDKKLSIEKEILIMGTRKSLQEHSPQSSRSCENLFQSFNEYSDLCEERKQEPSSDCFKTLFRNSTYPSVINSASFNRENLKTEAESMQEEIKELTSENPLHSANNSRCTQESIDKKNGNAVNSMIEHCENLVTSLEGLVASMSKNIDSINNQRLHKYCCKTNSQPNCSHSCACLDYCSELSYLTKNCCCKRINNHVCMECSKSACNRIYNHQIHANNYAVDNSGNSKQPYLVLPVRNEDIPSILHLVSKTS